jgi:hypothetical protein
MVEIKYALQGTSSWNTAATLQVPKNPDDAYDWCWDYNTNEYTPNAAASTALGTGYPLNGPTDNCGQVVTQLYAGATVVP